MKPSIKALAITGWFLGLLGLNILWNLLHLGFILMLPFVNWTNSWIDVHNSLYLLAFSLAMMTSPVELFLSIWFVYSVLGNIGHRKLYTAAALAAPLLLGPLVVAGLDHWLSHPNPHPDPQVNLHALDDYQVTSKSDVPLETEDGLSPQAKKSMREMLALQLAGGLQKQNNPVQCDIAGDDHDILVFHWSSMDEDAANELIQDFEQGDANFWNGARLMNFTEVDFTGDRFKKAITRQQIIGYSKNYDKYKAVFLKATNEFQGGVQKER